LRKVHGVTRRDKVRNCEILKAWNVGPLRVKRPQLRWFSHVTKIPQERARRVLLTKPKRSTKDHASVIKFPNLLGPVFVCGQYYQILLKTVRYFES